VPNASRSLLVLLGIALPIPAIAADLYPPIQGGIYEDTDWHRPPYTSGYVQGSYAGLVDAPDGMDGHAWALQGSINFNPEPSFNVQADIGNSWQTVEGFDADQFSGALHGYYRDHRFAVGGFFQAARLQDQFLSITGDDTITDYMGGVEAAYFAHADTLYGRFGYGQASWLGGSADHFMGTLGVRHYFTDNLRFDAEGMLNNLSYASADLDLRSIAVTGNFRPRAIPVTFFAGYRFDEAELSVPGLLHGTEDFGTAFGGVRVSFGSSSLKDEERYGSMWTASPLLP
jgi:hypothetical protein